MLGVLRHRDFGLLWTGQAVSLIGDGIYLVAIAWLVYDLSNSPAALGLVGLAWTLPQVMALLGSGVLSDRFERRRLLIAADLLRVAAIGGIAALTIADAVELWHVTVLVVFYGLGEALFLPAFSAIVPDVVPKEELLQAATLKELVEPIGLRFAGPAVGGALNATAGVGAAFAVDAVSFAVSAAVVSLMSRQPPPDKEPSPLRRELGQGFAYVRAHAWLWATLASAAVALLASFGPTEVLLPFIIRNDLDGGAGTFGLVLSAGGVGSVMAALVMSWTGAPRRHVTFMYLTWSLGIALQAGYAVAGAAWQMCVVAFLSFGCLTAGMVVWGTLIQTLVPAEMLGRVSSLDWFVSIGLVPVSFALTGPIAELVGAKATLAGAAAIGAASSAALFIPGVRAPEADPLPGGRRRSGAVAGR